MNTSKTTSRGVQESDVWAAADVLIAQGLRPTIERVRQQIGRGSPNTVSPMLETWFATPGRRLGVAGEQDPSVLQSVPDPVQRLAEELWNTALEEAKAAASKALDLREQALKAEEQALWRSRSNSLSGRPPWKHKRCAESSPADGPEPRPGPGTSS